MLLSFHKILNGKMRKGGKKKTLMENWRSDDDGR